MGQNTVQAIQTVHSRARTTGKQRKSGLQATDQNKDTGNQGTGAQSSVTLNIQDFAMNE